MVSKQNNKAKGTILIADSDEISSRRIKRFLKKRGYEVIITKDSEEVMRKIVYKDVVISFIDAQFSGNQGLRLIPKIKELSPSIYIVVSSSRNSLKIESVARKIGVFYYCLKPYDLKEVSLLIESIQGIFCSAA